MSVSVSTPAVINHLGDNTTADYPITFNTFQNSDVEVVVTEVADGTTYVLVESVDYSLNDIAVPGQNAEISLIDAAQAWMSGSSFLNTGYRLTVKFTDAPYQPSNLTNLGRFAATAFKNGLDRLTMLMKASFYQHSKSVQITDSDLEDGVDPSLPSFTGNTKKVLQVNATEDALEYGPNLEGIETSLTDHIADLANPHAVTKGQVGLGNCDNTSDVNKPVSTAQAAADAVVQADLDAHKGNAGNPHLVTKTQVGLGNVDNTSDLNKPVSTAQAAADAVIQADLDGHKASSANPHSVTKAQVGLGNVDNTADVDKPLSNAAIAEFLTKQDDVIISRGDLAVGDATNSAARLAKGAADTLLSSDGTDLTWVAKSSVGVTDHTALSNIGTNTHAQIDTHIADTTNPHAVTKTQVGLGNVVNLDTSTTANITDSTNKRFMTDAQETNLDNQSGTNTGDQDLTAINAHVADGTIHFTQAAISIPASQISDFDTEVSNNASVTANTAKVTNATHTGEVTGSGALTLDKTALSNRTDTVITASDTILFGDATDTDNLKKDTVQGILDLVPAPSTPNLQSVTTAGSTTTTGVTFNSGGTSTNDFLFGRASISTAKDKAIVWDHSKGAMSLGSTDPTQLSNFSFHGGEGDFINGGSHNFTFGKTQSGGYLTNDGIGSKVIGHALNSGTIKVYSYSPGAIAGGYADSAVIRATGAGASALGKVTSYATLKANEAGALVAGYANYYGNIYANGKGSRASGRAYRGYIGSPGDGATAGGVSILYSQMYSKGKGAFISGAAYGYAYMRAYGSGSFLVGYCAGGGMKATGDGSIAIGYTVNGTAYSTGAGSVMIGAFSGGNYSTGKGSIQFNSGTNNHDYSVKVGSGLHLFGTTSGTPSSLANGMMWVDNGHVYVRTNGVTKSMSSI